MKRGSIMLLLLVVFISACGQGKNSISEKNPQSEQLVLVENTEADVKISGEKQAASDMIRPLIVQIGKTSQIFDWQNVSNETYYPELHVIDLDNDGEQEFIIFLTLGYGTGIKESQVHVLRKDYTEIPFPNFMEDAQGKLHDSLTQDGEERTYAITVGEETNNFTFKEQDAVEWFEKAVVGSSVSFRVNGDEIVAAFSVQVSPGMALGNLEIAYKLVDGQFMEQSVQFVTTE